jgi:hypothetical protein
MPNTFGNYPANYLLFNQQLSKSLAIVMKIEGIPDIYGSSDTFQTVRYGDPGIVFGEPGLVYGGLRRVGGPNGVGGVKSYIQLDQGMAIQQRIEPEQGKGNIGTIAMTLVDKNGEVSYTLAPGNVVDEIMTGKQVTIYLGFQQTSYPEDYLIIYRGYITSIDCPPGLVRFQISDGTMKSRQPVFDTPSTRITTNIDAVQTSIPVLTTSGFYQQILGPNGSYDPIVHTYIKINDEIMEYGPTGIVDPTHFSVTRGALTTTPATHSVGEQVTNSIQFGFDATGQGVNFITLALKLLLSGWNGPCETNIALASLGFTTTAVSNAFVLATEDATLDLGLTVGDYFYISGATNPSNDVSGIVTGLQVLNSRTTIVLTNQTFIAETTTPAVAAFRSKYDTLPIVAGSKCRMRDVDVETLEYIRSTYFTTNLFDMCIYYDAPAFAKDIIASDMMLPFGCYQISRYGRISASVCKPPLPGIGKLVILDWNDVLEPQNIRVQRATNNRTFYNQIAYQYDFNVRTGNYESVQYFVDLASATEFNQVLTLPIEAKGVKSTFDGASLVNERGSAILNRYKRVALMLQLSVNWSKGSLIEVSDVVQLNDNGQLKIMNFNTGYRNLGSQLFEVIDRTYDVTNGNVKLTLLSGVGFDVNSRFGMISPSSNLDVGCTSTSLRLVPSFGQTSTANELAKWTSFFGLPIVVHNSDYSITGTSTLISLSLTDPNALVISPALPFTPSAGDVLEVASYPTDTDPMTNAQYKSLYAYFTPSVVIVSGISSTQFTVSSSDISKFIVGNTLIVRKPNWSIESNEVKIISVDPILYKVTTETIKDAFTSTPFTPSAGDYAEGLGFNDGLSFYRFD